MEYLMLEYREEATAGWAFAYADDDGESGRIFHLESQPLSLPAHIHPPATRPRDIWRLPRHKSGSGTNATRACGVNLRYDDITSQPIYFCSRLPLSSSFSSITVRICCSSESILCQMIIFLLMQWLSTTLKEGKTVHYKWAGAFFFNTLLV